MSYCSVVASARAFANTQSLQQSGPGNTFSYTNGGTDFFVQLMVLDALGSTVTRYASVHVASCGGTLIC